MFVSAKVHQRVLTELAVERDRVQTLDRHVTTQQALVSFMCARVNQLEAERAALLKIHAGIVVPVPVIAAAAAPHLPTKEPAVPLDLSSLSNVFEDMGDAEAKKRGVNWKPDGSVAYRETVDA